MGEMVRVIWDGERKFGVATGPQEAQFFIPGINNVEKEVWDKLVGDETCAVNIHLKGGKLKLASQEIQDLPTDSPDDNPDISQLSADSAIELIEQLMDGNSLDAARAQEKTKKPKPRKGVMAAIDERQAMFDKYSNQGDDSKQARDFSGDGR